jgi:phytoene dehydrogenase-like protein
MSEVVIAGAGLAGLTAASRLAEAGHDVTVFERRAEVGGRVRTRHTDGFTLDRGFQVLFPAYPAVRAELDLEALDLRRFAPGATICRPGHRAVLSDPLRDPGAALESAFNRDITLGDKLRVLALQRELARVDYEAIAAGEQTPAVDIRTYLRDRGFSERFLERFAAPFYGGITLDRSLSTAARVFAYTFKALSTSRASVPAAGMAAVPEQLAARARDAGADIRLEERVRAVESGATGTGGSAGKRGGDTEIETAEATYAADAVIVATDPKRATELVDVEGIPTEARGCVTQYYALPEPELPAGTRIMLNAAGTARSGREATGSGREATAPAPNTVAQLSAVAPEYAPDESVLLSATFLGEAAHQADEAELRTAAVEALSSWYPERRFDALERVGTERVPFAQFAQPPGIHDRLPGPDAPGGAVYLAGDFTQWSSIQGAIESGRLAADALLDDLY